MAAGNLRNPHPPDQPDDERKPMQITLKLRPKGRQSPVAAVRETIDSVRPELAGTADVSEVFPGVQTGNRAGMVVVRLESASDTDAVLEALRNRDDVVYAEMAQARSAR
jgi:hypothetical protein